MFTETYWMRKYLQRRSEIRTFPIGSAQHQIAFNLIQKSLPDGGFEAIENK